MKPRRKKLYKKKISRRLIIHRRIERMMEKSMALIYDTELAQSFKILTERVGLAGVAHMIQDSGHIGLDHGELLAHHHMSMLAAIPPIAHSGKSHFEHNLRMEDMMARLKAGEPIEMSFEITPENILKRLGKKD